MEVRIGVEEIEKIKNMYAWWRERTPNTKERIKKRSEKQKNKDSLYMRFASDEIKFTTSDLYYWFISTSTQNEVDYRGVLTLDFQEWRDKKISPKKIIGIRLDLIAFKAYITIQKNKKNHIVYDFSLAEAPKTKEMLFLYKRLAEIEDTETNNTASIDFKDFTYGFCGIFDKLDEFVFTQEEGRVELSVKNHHCELNNEFLNSSLKEKEIRLTEDSVSFYSFFGEKVELSKGKIEGKAENGKEFSISFFVGETAGVKHYSLY